MAALGSWLAERPFALPLFLLGALVVGPPLKNLLATAAGWLAPRAAAVDSTARPLLRTATPWTPPATFGRIAAYFERLLRRPVAALWASVLRLAQAIRSAPSWRVEIVAGAVIGVVQPALTHAVAFADAGSDRVRAVAHSTAEALRGPERHFIGWRVAGGVLFALGLAGFLYADLGISIASHEQATQTGGGVVPDLLRNLALQYAVASFLSALMLGFILFDFIGMTHLGPWEDLRGWPRNLVLGLVVVVMAAFIVIAGFLALWRADEILLNRWLSPETSRSLLGWALTLPVPLMYVATALVAWGAVALPWLLILIAAGVALLVLRLAAFVLRAGLAMLVPLGNVLTMVLRLCVVVGLVAAIVALTLAIVAVILAGAVAIAEVIGAAAVVVALWTLLWLAGHLGLAGLLTAATIADGAATILYQVINLLMWPAASVWNWIAGFDIGRRLHLGAVALDGPGGSRRTTAAASAHVAGPTPGLRGVPARSSDG